MTEMRRAVIAERGSRLESFVRLRGARENNLKNVDVEFPRDAIVAFTGISGSGKSSLVYETLFAEAQRRFLESVSPYARRLLRQLPAPRVESIDGLPPAVALRQQRGAPSQRSSVGSVTTLSNLLRMLFSRAGSYPPGLGHLDADAFSSNTAAGACPRCLGQGRAYDATEASMVPDSSISIREKAIAAWPPAWHGQNLRDICVSLGFDVDRPWRDLPQADRDWILFTEDRPTVRVYPGLPPSEARAAVRRSDPGGYNGTFIGARRFLLESLANSQSIHARNRAARHLTGTQCPSCRGKRLRPEALSVHFAGRDIADLSRLTLLDIADLLRPYAAGSASVCASSVESEVVIRIASDLSERIDTLVGLGLGYLSLDRSTSTLSSGELQRLRIATQLRANLFGVIYVLDEPSAGLHPSDTEALSAVLSRLKSAGNTICLVEHNLDLIGQADWIVDVGPGAGDAGGRILFSGPPEGLAGVEASRTRPHLFGSAPPVSRKPRSPKGWLRLAGVTLNNIDNVEVSFPLGVFTGVCGVSGSGKSSLVSRALVELATRRLDAFADGSSEADDPGRADDRVLVGGTAVEGLDMIRRVVVVDQRTIGRTSRSNIATYTGMFDHVRRIFAETESARARGFDAGHFSFNAVKGRCSACDGEGTVSVELLFLPEVRTTCPSCGGARYDAPILEVLHRGRTVADVLGMTVDQASAFFAAETRIRRTLEALHGVGLGYISLGRPVTELSGGEAQRLKLASELQRPRQEATLYVLDEPTAGLHPSDVDLLVGLLDQLVDRGSSVVIVEHDPRVLAGLDWIIEIGPAAGDAGGRIVASSPPFELPNTTASRMERHLRPHLDARAHSEMKDRPFDGSAMPRSAAAGR